MTTISIYTKRDQDKEYFKKSLGDRATLHFYDSAEEAPHPDTDIVSVFTYVPVTREMMDALPKLRLIAVRATGVDHIDIAAAKEKGIAVAHVGGYGATTVAEYAITLLLMLTRHMTVVLSESCKSKPDRTAECGIDVYGKTMGIIGTGAIGMGVARIARGLGMQTLGYDVYPNKEKAQEVGLVYAESPEDVLKRSDVVTLHMPLLDSTRHFMTAERLAMMKKGAILLNTARGELVETKALVNALESGHLWAAGLDVTEAGTDEDVLRAMDNVIVTNHNAYNTVEAINLIDQKTTTNIINFLDGKGFDEV